MKKLSIQSLTGKPTGSHKIISVNTLADTSRDISEINTDIILKTIRLRREKKIEIFTRHFHNCFEKMRILNNMNKTEMFYVVPLENHEIYDYDPVECCTYLEIKLKEKHLDVMVLDKKTLFVMWKNLESYIKKSPK